MANSVDPEQTASQVQYNLGPSCLLRGAIPIHRVVMIVLNRFDVSGDVYEKCIFRVGVGA